MELEEVLRNRSAPFHHNELLQACTTPGFSVRTRFAPPSSRTDAESVSICSDRVCRNAGTFTSADFGTARWKSIECCSCHQVGIYEQNVRFTSRKPPLPINTYRRKAANAVQTDAKLASLPRITIHEAWKSGPSGPRQDVRQKNRKALAPALGRSGMRTPAAEWQHKAAQGSKSGVSHTQMEPSPSRDGGTATVRRPPAAASSPATALTRTAECHR